MELAETDIKLQEQHEAKIKKRNEILLFSNSPGGPDSEIAKWYFAREKAAALK